MLSSILFRGRNKIPGMYPKKKKGKKDPWI